MNIDSASNEAPLGTTLAYDILKSLPAIPAPRVYILQITLYGVVTETRLPTPYQGNTYACTDESSMGTATFEILDGTQSAKYFFQGDQYSEPLKYSLQMELLFTKEVPP